MLAESSRPESSATETLQCVCGSHDLQDLGPCRPPCTFGLTPQETALSEQVSPGRLYRCRRCHLGLRLPRPEQQKLEQLYSSMSSERWTKETPLSTAQQRVAAQLRNIAIGTPTQILDVGAFDGRFLESLPDRFQKSAIEPSSGGRAMLSKKNIRVLKPFLESASPIEQQSFDMVTMFDVFEHLTDPLGGVRALMSYVKPGGKLIIGTGDLDHWSWRATRGFHWYLDPIQHVSVGSRRHFEWLLSELPPCILRMTTLSHQAGTFLQKLGESGQMLYFAARQRRQAGRLLVRCMHVLPQFRRLAHKEAVPYTQRLGDHLVVEFTRGRGVD